MKKLLLSTAVLALTAACQPATSTDTAATETPAASTPAAATASAAIGDWGFDISGMDTSYVAGDDFYRYANGTWLDTTEIPSDRSNYGMFTELAIEAEEQVQAIILELAAMDAADGSIEQKVGDLYGSWMDTATIDQLGLAPAQPYLDEIAAAETHADINALFATIHHQSPYGVGIIPDPADTTRYTVFVGQGGLGLPDRDYYLEEDNQGARDAYLAFIAQIFDLAGIEDGTGKAQAIFDLEMRIAESHWTQADSRNIQMIYNPMPLDQLSALAPQLSFQAGMEQLGLDGVATYLVAQPSAIEAAGTIFEETPVDVWKDYMTFHYIRSNAGALPEAFDAANFAMFGTTLNGIEEQRPRDRRGVNLVGGQLGEAVGQVYVDRHFPPESKTAMEALVANLIVAFEGRLAALEWMDEETRANALQKLSTFEPRIGYPDEWQDYSALEVRADDLFGNLVRLTEFQWNEQVADLSGPVDRSAWPYPPQTVNASYNPLMNQITFPAGILQAPFFDPNADAAINYGAIGAVIGHEIGHGFDDQGRRFDYDGSIRDWWTVETNERFEERADILEAQYDGYEPIEGSFVNGEFTMGENIGDLGGLQMAYTAYQRHLDACCDGEAPVIDGFTGEQRFFLAWAQVWRRLYREENLRNRLTTDPHSPAQYRTNGVVRNLDVWYEAFGVTEDNDLYLPPEERVSIW
ncbi:endothelin-converting enzyme, Metallo peptidase, MEROPS family M13 [Maricaulis maris MCS10]|uniref:Endothelin-converting enzyme, Metallo peptidase, MEROPS family M13 n=1 Tax=Maricaulis maris (strain MCS10) TaxID=394221 RepID=Q0ASH0_MARMM|nr:M13 family metallopeptidase [Maricaulis maris]ABI64767.1 endothelin-converting enzyme, Metallo peptidase, MEROPS family M13 [Maricaulis maris MCS10]